MAAKINTTRVEFLDYLRGFMAISVMLYHYSSWSNIHYIYPIDQTLSRLGIYAVSAFYVLSGASLAIVYSSKQVNKSFLTEFVIKRFFRIAPLFYAIITLALLRIVVLALNTNDFSIVPNFKVIILNYTLTFGWIKPGAYFTAGAWSIGNELVFYSIFPIMLFLKNKSLKHYLIFTLVTILISGYISLCLLTDQITLTNQWTTYINPLNQLYLFASGFLIGVLIKQNKKTNKRILSFLLLLSISVFVFLPIGSSGEISLVTGYPKLILSISTITLCFVAAFWGNTKQNKLTSGLKYLGDISYSIYLIHPIVYLILIPFFQKNNSSDSKITLIIVSIVSSFVFSTITHQYLEKPFMKLGKKVHNKTILKIK